MADTDSGTTDEGAAKKTAAKKSPAKKAASKRTPSKRTAGKKTASKRTAGKKSAAKKSADSSEQSTPRHAAATAESDERGHRSSSDGQRQRTSPLRIAAVALEQLAALTGRPSEGVVGIQREDDEWIVEIEVLELRRIPNTTDVLARYRVTADDQGDVTGYRRLQRYVRGAAGEE